LPAIGTRGKTLTQYADPERHSAQRYRRTDRQTDNNMMPRADHSARSTIGWNR